MLFFSHFVIHTLSIAIAFAQVEHVQEPQDLPAIEIVEEVEPVRLLFLGDIMLGRYVGELISNNFDPFELVHDRLATYDLVSANLEGPITGKEDCQDKAYSFKFATSTASLLAHHNIHAVTLANNHSLDCYNSGLADTRLFLDDAGVANVGGGNDVDSIYRVVNIGDQQIALVGYDLTLGSIALDTLYTTVEELDRTYSYVVVQMHWGEEYQSIQALYQEKIAHRLVEKGADLIIGHHPHVMQPAEIYQGVPIFYSLGNFVFDQYFGDTTKGYAVEVLLGSSTSSYEILPYAIVETQPKFLEHGDAMATCHEYISNSSSDSDCFVYPND